MTDMVKVQQAVSEMQKASFSVDVWCKSVARGNYNYKNTHIYKALKSLEAGATATPPPPKPPVPPSSDLSDVQRCLFLTNDISNALRCSGRLLVATADPSYRPHYTTGFLNQAIAENRLRVWCDCHTTMPSTAFAWLDDLGLPHEYFYGECESAGAFKVAYDSGSRRMVGNLSVLTYNTDQQPNSTTNQLGLLMQGRVHVTNETYFNVNPNYRVDWRNANAGVGSNCMAVYASSSENAMYYSLEAQVRDGKYNPAVDCVYVAGFQPADWAFLIAN